MVLAFCLNKSKFDAKARALDLQQNSGAVAGLRQKLAAFDIFLHLLCHFTPLFAALADCS